MLSQSQSQLDESASDSVDDVSHLTQQWINERNAPQLLRFEGGAVERILELLQAQTDTLEDLNNLDESNDEFIRSVYALEMERIKFVLRSYFRARLSKIELNTLAILTNPEYRRNLSENELTYAERFNDITNENYKKSFLDEACPPSLQNLSDPETAHNPNMNQAVFCRIKKDIGAHLLPNGDTIDLSKNKIYLLLYRIIRPFVETGEAELI